MTKTVVIKNLKQIKSLEFSLPGPGVHILAGTNGAGKSCLLTCLLRIGRPNAFQNSFLTSKISEKLDLFEHAEITYSINGSAVSYRYSGERWSPSPKSQSRLLKDFGYPFVIYAAANAERIEPRADDFKPNRVREAPPSIRKAAIKILGDEKFENLKVVNVRRGVGAEAFLMMKTDGRLKKTTYYSEKNFSLGEICVLKLLRQLETCPEHSLVLIDELELALHPRAQTGLLEHLEHTSEAKNLTVIFSTHSANLIKNANRDHFYFLEKTKTDTRVLHQCYPTYALGQIASKDERAPDVVIYVEDEQARLIVDHIVRKLINSEMAGKSKPTIITTPVGGASSVIAFLKNSNRLLASTVKQVAMLDADVDEQVEAAKRTENFKELVKYQDVDDRVYKLPWTPEVGICDFLISDKATHEKNLKDYFDDQRINFDHIDPDKLGGLSGGDLRKAAKKLLDSFINEISAVTGRESTRVREGIVEYFVDSLLAGSTAPKIKKLFMPIIR